VRQPRTGGSRRTRWVEDIRTLWNQSEFCGAVRRFPFTSGILRTAFELWQELHLTEVLFLPPAVRRIAPRTRAKPELRLAMVRAAVAGQAGFVVDDREVRRTRTFILRLIPSPSATASIRIAPCVCSWEWMHFWDCRTGIAGA